MLRCTNGSSAYEKSLRDTLDFICMLDSQRRATASLVLPAEKREQAFNHPRQLPAELREQVRNA